MRAVGGARVTTRHRYAQMYVVPYPYHCVMVYDDTPDYAFVRQDDFAEFVQVHRLVRDSFGVSCCKHTDQLGLPDTGPSVAIVRGVFQVLACICFAVAIKFSPQKNRRADVVRKREHRQMIRALDVCSARGLSSARP